MSRVRAHTTGFAFNWRGPLPSVSNTTPTAESSQPPQPTLDIPDLISLLNPPAVPSLSYTRALASLLPTASPIPRRELLAPIWLSLCSSSAPPAIQAAGFDLLGAYFENENSEPLSTSDRLTYFSLFAALGEWAVETWEPRLKALRGMTGYGSDILGIEEPIIELLTSWIQTAYDGLLVLEARAINGEDDPSHQGLHLRFNTDERNERNERERCIMLCADFVTKILEKPENLARLPDQALDSVISFYGTLVDRAVQLPRTKGYDPASEDPEDALPVHAPSTLSPAGQTMTHKSIQSHKRSASTSTSASVSTTMSAPPTILAYLKHPLEIAVALYLAHLSTRLKTLLPGHLQDVIPTLFRATAFCATPLYRLSIVAKFQPPSFSQSAWKRDIEDKIADFLAQLLSGSYATLSKLILSVWLGPPGTTPRLFDPPPLFPIAEQPQQIQPSLGLTPLQNSPVPTQPGTPVPPPPASLPPSQQPQPLPPSYFPSSSFHASTSTSSLSSHVQSPTFIQSTTSSQLLLPHPLHPTSSTLFTIHTCLGAHRTLRTILRRSLISRLARAYASREAANAAYHSTAGPSRFDIDSDNWPGGGGGVSSIGDPSGTWKELKGNEWDIVRTGRTLTWAVRSWVTWESSLEAGVRDDEAEEERLEDAVERVLEEVAGVLKDLLQEVDERNDDNYGDPSWVAGYAGGNGIERIFIEEDESVAIGETLFELAGWVKRLKNVDGTPYTIRLRPQQLIGRHRPSHSFSRTSSASTIQSQSTPASTHISIAGLPHNPPVTANTTPPGSPSLIRTLTTLLSRSHFATPLRPLLALTLTFISNHLTDADLAPLPDTLKRMSELTPTSLDWLDNWSSVLGVTRIKQGHTLSKGKAPPSPPAESGGPKDAAWMEKVISERESGQLVQPPQEDDESDQEGGGGGLVGLGSHFSRRKTREEVMAALDKVYDSVRDMGTYRRALADVVCQFAAQAVSWTVDATSLGIAATLEVRDEFEVVWRLLADEVVLRTLEGCPFSEVGPFLDLLLAIARDGGAANVSPASKALALTLMGTTIASVLGNNVDSATPAASNLTSPVISRMQSEYAGTGVGTGTIVMPSATSTGGSGLISSLLSLAAGTSSSSTMSPTSSAVDDSVTSPISLPATAPTSGLPSPDVHRTFTGSPQPPPNSEAIFSARSLCGVSALVSIFSQLAFSPFLLEWDGVRLVLRMYETLVTIAGDVGSQSTTPEARLAALTFLMRLRADADHRVFFIDNAFDANGSVEMLAGLIGRVKENSSAGAHGALPSSGSTGDRLNEGTTRTRARTTHERLGRQGSKGRGQTGTGAGPRRSSSSRSRVLMGLQSQTTTSPAAPTRPRDPLWYFPQMLPFVVEADTPSEAIPTYDSTQPESPSRPLLPVDKYLQMLISLLENEKEWELISYALCHLPSQLSNKHFFCDSRSKVMLSRMVTVLCAGLLKKTLASGSSRQRDAQGLAHHTLEVLIGYWRCLDLQQRHTMVEVFHAGLNEQLSTVKCCLQALTLASFELPHSTTKYLPRIMESLSQIMSNPDMAVYILAYLSIVVSLPPLYANFTEEDFKTVFGVALQYLQHYSRHNASPTVSWALSQHVRVLSYYVIYIWFLAVRLPDRAKHIKYITRQLLIANEGSDTVDGPTDVCFDWLARYTYTTADPRPANSLLADIVMNSTNEESPEVAVKEKTWVIGNAVITIRALARLGWLEVLARRPSGLSKFLCRVENAPFVGPGEVDLDSISVPAVLLMERDPPQVLRAGPEDYEGPLFSTEAAETEHLKDIFDGEPVERQKLPGPDPVTGYVWRGSAPSQRRKEVLVDPSYLALQLSPYPSPFAPRLRADPAAVSRFVNTIDRIPVIDTHKVGILYVAPGQTSEVEILRNTHGSPAYTRFLEGLGRLINLRGQLDVYAGGLDPDEDGEYAYAWWDDIGQILYHTATMMPTNAHDPQSNNKKRHIGNDYVRIVWNDSGSQYRFDTLSTQYQFVNIVIEPHSAGAIATYSNTTYDSEYFKVTVQRATGMTEFVPVGNFKLISGQNLPLLVRQLSLLSDWFASIFAQTNKDTTRNEVKTNWQMRLEAIARFKKNQLAAESEESNDITKGESYRDFTQVF